MSNMQHPLFALRSYPYCQSHSRLLSPGLSLHSHPPRPTRLRLRHAERPGQPFLVWQCKFQDCNSSQNLDFNLGKFLINVVL